MRKQNWFTVFLLLLVSAVITSCSGNKKKEREKAINDSIARATIANDSIKKIEEYFPKQLVIQGTNVNLRVAPKLDAVIIKQLKPNDSCEVLEKGTKQTVTDKTDYWYRVRFKNKEGWVFGAFTSIRLPSATEEKQK